MSNVNKFNENLFNDWSKMDLSDYEKEYFKKFNRTSKSIETYYEQYAKLYNSDTESSSNDETDSVSDTKTETKVVVSKPNNVIVTNNNLVNVNTSISSFFMEFNGFKIRQRESDGYIHATDMCKISSTMKWANYFTNKFSKKFINELSADTNILASELINSTKGGNKNNQGTWIHPRIAINLAQWISAEFAVKVSKWVIEWSEYNEKNKQELIYSLSNLKPDEPHENKEQLIQLKLQEELGGEIEVEYEGNFIDLLTDTEIIEIKKANKWKHALGQLLVYSDGFPNHKKRLHLFDNDDVNYKRIKKHCDKFNVKVTYE